MNYLEKNKKYWENGYNAVNVDHQVFRFYGRILKPEFGLEGNGEKLVDFGCGQGASVNYFQHLGFNARGVDISEIDISVGKTRYPYVAKNLLLCNPLPAKNEFYGFKKDVSVVIA